MMYDCGRDYEKDMALEELEALRDKIVLCKDCVHWKEYKTLNGDIYHLCESYSVDPYECEPTGADDFCSRGVREDEIN